MGIVCPACGTQNSDDAKFCAECATPLTEVSRPRESRRMVTILFADVSGSTTLGEQLDPESLRGLMGRYFADMQAIIEHHGGTVEKFIGDAVMAVFGVPRLHEDDALRAVRAAAEIGERLARLNAELEAERGIAIRFRTGVNSGEVVAGDPSSGQTLVLGDAVNTAARLEQAATPGEILIGPLTYQLVRDAVTVEPLEPLSLKGKAQPLAAYRLTSVTPGAAGHARRLDAPMIGRQAELTALQDAFATVLAERRCGLVTVLGAAGVGKTRLLAEFLAAVRDQATVLVGRCLPYGEGISYWPIAQVVRAAAGIDEADDREAALAKLQGLAAGMSEAEIVAERVAQAIGLARGSAPQEEIFWAVRKLLEIMARQRPLVIEFDDLQWADDTLLDMLELIVSLAYDAPLLLVCPARPELLERRPGWGSGLPEAATLRLEPLAPETAGQLIDQLPGGARLSAALRGRILKVAEGNPLFVEEMLAMLIDEGPLSGADGDWQAGGALTEVAVPPTISALLAARLDQLQPGERSLAQRASVVGQSFEQAALAELLPAGQGGAMVRDLLGLVRKDLIRPDRALLSAGDAYRFRHLLIRDAAYEALPKAERAELHARFADWLERVTGDRLEEFEEIIGYHLEQAHRYQTELGLLDANAARLANRAALRLFGPGRRARLRDDSVGAAGLLERALALLSDDDPQRWMVVAELIPALTDVGRQTEALELADDALGRPDLSASDRALIAVEAIEPMTLGGREVGALQPLVEDALEFYSGTADQRGIGRALSAKADLDYFLGNLSAALVAHEQGLEHSRRAGDVTAEGHHLDAIAGLRFQRGDPPDQVQQARNALRAYAAANNRLGLLVSSQAGTAVLLGIAGDFDGALDALDAARAMAADLGLRLLLINLRETHGVLAWWAGDRSTAAAELEAFCNELIAIGDRGRLSTAAAELALVLSESRQLEAADRWIGVATDAAASDDVVSQVMLMAARAAILAQRTATGHAVQLASEAVSNSDGTEYRELQIWMRLVLSDVASMADAQERAVAAAEEALDLSRQSQFVPFMRRSEEVLRRLRSKTNSQG